MEVRLTIQTNTDDEIRGLAENVDFVTVLGPKGWMKARAKFKEAHARMFKTPVHARASGRRTKCL
jgi:hypothetical protein